MIKGREKAAMRAFAAAIALGAAGAAGMWASHAVAQTRTPAPSPTPRRRPGRPSITAVVPPAMIAGGETIRLIGAGFTDAWRTRTTRDLYTRIKTTMPFSNPGSLSDAEAASVVAYILKSNGAAAGTAAFTPTTDVAINTIIAAGAGAGRPVRGLCQPQRHARRHRHHRSGNGGKIHAGHRRDAAESAGRRLADALPELCRLEPFAAEADQHQERAQSAASLGLVAGRWRAPADHAPGA